MFMKTIAVGPLEPRELCVTGGATVAIRHLCEMRLLAVRRVEREATPARPLRAVCAAEHDNAMFEIQI